MIPEINQAGSSSKKRNALHSEQDTCGPIQKVAKIHPFFAKPIGSVATCTGPFAWLDSLGPTKSCLHGISLNPSSSEKIAAFDLDGTLIKSEFVNKAIKSTPHWEWWRAEVPAKLKMLYESGYAIVIISNQAIKPQALITWKQKIISIAAALSGIPFRLFAATAKDNYRKPMPGMWSELENIFRQDGVEIDKKSSFFVGDAAGRQYNNRKCDFSSTDRKWALNIGIPFFTPEEYFLELPPHTFSLPGFHVSALPELPLFTSTSTPLLPSPPRQEVVLFVGYPCLGKSTFYRNYFQPAGYVHINQDTLMTRNKCVKATREALQEGKSCVIDNTNRDAPTRKQYIDVAKQMGISIRCLLFTGSIDLAWHNNLYRAYTRSPPIDEPRRAIVPYSAFTSFRDSYKEPELSEGISEIKKVNWIFHGSEEEKKRWTMWHQIDGK